MSFRWLTLKSEFLSFGRVPIPFVRQMVTQEVANTARAEQVGLVDVPFFERAATF